ncbi:hypothetical protein QBC47DRAFT_405797 [Echria macrotheca]|uniref:Uncharacterized protein n=1 Tax=Echria macrotheca TaxID=438768 RepID=A0AAJ0B5V0_9PEZI|nr:hypothetical protein QBC47DRAFT_405797 [Echria macrotheca]
MFAPGLILSAFAASSLASAIPRSQGSVLDTRMMTTELSILAQFEFAPYELTNICLDCKRPNATANYGCEVKFDWHDPNSVRQNNVSSCACQYSWTWDGVSVIGGDSDGSDVPYETCWKDERTYFEMALVTFEQPGNFTLKLAHHYKDSENFTAPWEYPTTFSRPNILLPVVDKTENQITLFTEGVVNGTINGISN